MLYCKMEFASAMINRLQEALVVDLPRLRTKLAMFFFHCIPDLYTLSVVRAMLMRAAGIALPVTAVYARSPLYIDRGSNLSIGRGTFINLGVYFENSALVSIGERCQIGPCCLFLTTNHREGRDESLPVRIGNDVWLGAGVKVLPGAVIGDGITIAAGAVVSGEIRGGSLWGGVPAKQIR